MTKKQNTAAIGLLTIRHKPKKEKPVFIPQPLPQPKPKPEPKPEPLLEPDSVPTEETIQIPETPLRENHTSETETAPGHLTPAEKPEIPEQHEAAAQTDTANQTDSGYTPEIVPQTGIASEKENGEKETEEVPDSIPQTEIPQETGPADNPEGAPQTEPSADKKSPDLPEPEFTIQPLDFKTSIIPETELPESVTEIADITHAYAVLKKTNQEGLLERYPRAAYFNLFLQEMYKRARTNGTVRYYEYAGKKALDFPIENDMGYERLFASFVPHEKETGK